jgi:ethanolamine utilization protein EutN
VILGKVVGEVWATRKHPRLSGSKLLIVQPTFWYQPAHEAGHLVAVDRVGANVGDRVVVCMGAPARAHEGSPNVPIEAAVMAIVDEVALAPAADWGKRAPKTVQGASI